MGKIAVPLGEGFEEIEAIVILDMLRRADINVVAAGLNSKEVTGSHGLVLMADTLLSDLPARGLDGIVLPGGQPGTKNLMKNSLLRDLLIRLDKEDKLVAAICAAPMVLHAAGILSGKRVACYPGCERGMEDVSVVEEPVVMDNNLITSRGIGTALAFALAIIEKLKGKTAAQTIRQAVLA
ncbi:MAG: hypothetical protein A2293_04460 [Elusimicrobia bacterium RIFOXYB2_FULL_49_7]|nr:MAG: hypothetical protein A2293_04460 [Elusimicrobia bacterium RIFOXYB2_FULL_49_7]